MAYESSITNISLQDRVRFKDERLVILTPADRKRLEGRVGVVQGYWNFTRKLTVCFPQDGSRSELRILSVDPRQLERVMEGIDQTEVDPKISKEASSDNTTLSQEDTDNLFG